MPPYMAMHHCLRVGEKLCQSCFPERMVCRLSRARPRRGPSPRPATLKR